MSHEFRHKDAVSGRVRENEYEHLRQHILNDQATGDMVYASSATQLSGLPKGADNTILAMGASIPEWKTPAAVLADISPLTTRGDIMFRNATISTRLAKGADNTILAMGANDPEWKPPAVILGDLTGANLDVGAFDVRGLTLTADGLPSGRVVLTGANGVLSSDSDITFATDTLTVTKIAATIFTGVITMTLASAVASHLIIAGTAKINSGEQAIYINFPAETAAVNGIWITLKSTVTSGDLTGVRSRVYGNAASAGANVRGGYFEAKMEASKYAAMLEGVLSHADYSAGSITISGDVRGFTAHISQGAGLNAANLYGILVSIQTRGDETITTDDVGLCIKNEGVGGAGRQMDAAILVKDVNVTASAYGYGIDLNGAGIATADIRFHHGTTLLDDGTDLTLAGADFNIGTSKIVMSPNSSIYDGGVGTIWFRNAAGSEYTGIRAYGMEIHFLSALSSYIDINALNSDSFAIRFYARDTGVGLVQVAEVRGAADPYFGCGGASANTFKFHYSGITDFGHNVMFSASVDSVAVADQVSIGGYEISAGHRALAISSEEVVVTEAIGASDRTLPVRINGATYKLMLVAV